MRPNPFELEAVAVFGRGLSRTAEVESVRRCRQELHAYLERYPESDEMAIGGALGISGGHGAGKTHILYDLRNRLEGFESIRGQALYAKADNSSLFDVYRQFAGSIPRERLIELLDLALKQLAIAHVKRARVTEDLASGIEGMESLDPLENDDSVDLQDQARVLRDRLTDAGIPGEMARALLAVSNPEYGEQAYQWLIGADPQRIPQLRITGGLHDLPVSDVGSAGEAGMAAIYAIEALAIIHRTAKVPLLLLLDQLEVLLRGDEVHLRSLFSTLKKFIEHVGRRKALMFMAGGPEAWRMLPRDFPPRLRRREPFRAGGLSRDEAKELINAHLGKGTRGFDEKSVDRLLDLSGGSPREIIRIAFHAWEKTGGEFKNASPDTLLECARESGTVADRVRLALQKSDEILEEFGKTQRDLGLQSDQGQQTQTEWETRSALTLDRILFTEGVPTLALHVLAATDKLSEIDSARRTRWISEYLADVWPGVPLLAVSVGYSSDEVRELLDQSGVRPIHFDELQFEANLRSEVLELAARTTEGGVGSFGRDELLATLADLSSRLDELDRKRLSEMREVQAAFAEASAQAAKAADEVGALDARRDILVALERLEMSRGDLVRERNLTQSLLITNEAHLRNPRIKSLGRFYLEFLVHELMAEKVGPGPELETLRTASITMMRGVLSQHWLKRLFDRHTSGMIAGGLFGLAAGWVWGVLAPLITGDYQIESLFEVLALPFRSEIWQLRFMVFLSVGALTAFQVVNVRRILFQRRIRELTRFVEGMNAAGSSQ